MNGLYASTRLIAGSSTVLAVAPPPVEGERLALCFGTCAPAVGLPGGWAAWLEEEPEPLEVATISTATTAAMNVSSIARRVSPARRVRRPRRRLAGCSGDLARYPDPGWRRDADTPPRYPAPPAATAPPRRISSEPRRERPGA